MKRLVASFAGLTLCLLLVGSATAAEWNAAEDYGVTNPSGPWSYGHSSFYFGQQFNPYQLTSSYPLLIWGGGWLQAYGNVSDSIVGNCETDWCVRPGELALHPSNSGVWSVLRFTAPEDGEYAVNATFKPADRQVKSIKVGIYGPAGYLLTDFLTYYDDVVTFEETVSLQAGQVIDFGVHRGDYGYYDDGTVIDVQIANGPTCGNLVVNGSFEETGPDSGWWTLYAGSNTMTGWTIEAGNLDLGNYCPSYWESTHGIHNVDMNGGGPATISQTLPTIPGQQYELSFRMGANNYCGIDAPTMRVSAGDVVEDFTFDRGPWTGTPLTAGQWAYYGFVFTATSSQTKLTFQSLVPSCGGPTLDSVWVDTLGCEGGWPEETNCFLPVQDSDGDGVPDNQDVCPGFDDKVDTDEDGAADGCDACPLDWENDGDGDGICETDDNCPDVPNANQANADGDEFGDACEPDNDDDGVLDDYDNCPMDPNADQADFDGDGVGDVCDMDDDGDAVVDGEDVCLNTPVGEPVLANGCSVAQECVCEAAWKNHGAYVSCVAHASEWLLEQGLISLAEKDAMCSAAGQSACGHKKKK